MKDGAVEQSNFNDYTGACACPTCRRRCTSPSSRATRIRPGSARSARRSSMPAVANAFHKLTGKRLYHMPFTPERVMETAEGLTVPCDVPQLSARLTGGRFAFAPISRHDRAMNGSERRLPLARNVRRLGHLDLAGAGQVTRGRPATPMSGTSRTRTISAPRSSTSPIRANRASSRPSRSTIRRRTATRRAS